MSEILEGINMESKNCLVNLPEVREIYGFGLLGYFDKSGVERSYDKIEGICGACECSGEFWGGAAARIDCEFYGFPQKPRKKKCKGFEQS